MFCDLMSGTSPVSDAHERPIAEESRRQRPRLRVAAEHQKLHRCNRWGLFGSIERTLNSVHTLRRHLPSRLAVIVESS